MFTYLHCGYKPHFRCYLQVRKIQSHLSDENAYTKWIGKILNVAVILIYNILEINYNVMLVHFHENRHNWTMLFTQKDLL